MEQNFFISIDFDGTVADRDITDAIIQEFAAPEWEEVEKLWEAGSIGSRECLSAQMSLIDLPLHTILAHAGKFAVNRSFIGFVDFLRKHEIPFCIISDGFRVVIERLLANAGLKGIPVYANTLSEENGRLKASFPYSRAQCSSGTCKCRIAGKLSRGLPVVHIGDGRSDFCIAEKAAYVFSKGKLTAHCKASGLAHTSFEHFRTVEKSLAILLAHTPPAEGAETHHGYHERWQELWNPAL
ncbi:MAG TPA: MtnX-like HAD-IB family phosphatase [Dissulfurispiraceae bacterium]